MEPLLERYAEVLKDSEWVKIPFKDLREGDIFRLFESDGTPVESDTGVLMGRATSDAFETQLDGLTVLAINTEDINDKKYTKTDQEDNAGGQQSDQESKPPESV